MNRFDKAVKALDKGGMTEPTIFNKMAHPEPSLSADLAATLQTTTATISSLFRSLKELSHTVDVESNMKAARLDALEKKTNGLIQTRADHGHQFIVIIDRVKALEERVAAMEQQFQCREREWDLRVGHLEHEAEPTPLPKEDLD